MEIMILIKKGRELIVAKTVPSYQARNEPAQPLEKWNLTDGKGFFNWLFRTFLSKNCKVLVSNS